MTVISVPARQTYLLQNMIKTTAVELKHAEKMMVTWDIGKRCNFDCTYCDSTRHTNDSPHASLETLIETFQFVKAWTSLYNSKRIVPDDINMNFTGGEPTNNPHFWDFIDYITTNHPNFAIGITTNGTWNSKKIDIIKKHRIAMTVSVHMESDDKIRQMALQNILALHQAGGWLQVNVMLHMDHWDRTMEACDFLDSHNIKYSPVPVGDGPTDTAKWVSDHRGIMRRTTHTYSAEQQQWFFNKMGITAEQAEERKGNKLGRACCGSRQLCGKVDNQWQDVKLINTEFKDWNCMVDWYFLHIDQEYRQVYHHQTCQALRGGKRGPIGSLDDTNLLLENLKNMLEQPNVEPIVCPNQRCGCGMCVPKAKETSEFKIMWTKLTNVPIQETQI